MENVELAPHYEKLNGEDNRWTATCLICGFISSAWETMVEAEDRMQLHLNEHEV